MKKFNRHDVTVTSLKEFMIRKGWPSGAATNNRYSPAEIRFLAKRSHMYRKDLLPLFVKKFDRPDMTIVCLESLCQRHGLKTGRYRGVQELGAESISKDGIYVRVGERSQLGRRNYVLKHRLLWEQKNGPPRRHRLECLDGNLLNADPSNWECVPNGVLSRLANDFENAPAVLKPIS